MLIDHPVKFGDEEIPEPESSGNSGPGGVSEHNQGGRICDFIRLCREQHADYPAVQTDKI